MGSESRSVHLSFFNSFLLASLFKSLQNWLAARVNTPAFVRFLPFQNVNVSEAPAPGLFRRVSLSLSVFFNGASPLVGLFRDGFERVCWCKKRRQPLFIQQTR